MQMQIANADGDGDASCIQKMAQMTTRTLRNTHSHTLAPQVHTKNNKKQGRK